MSDYKLLVHVDELHALGIPGRKAHHNGLLLRYLKRLDERTSVKALLSVWGPRLDFLVRLILVLTFLDDSFRAATHFSDHTHQIGQEGYFKSLAEASPEVVGIIATVALSIGLLVQSIGSLCLLALWQTDGAIVVLIGWTIAQPVLYAQLANGEFVARSLSLVGGLLILRGHLIERAMRLARHHVPLGGGMPCAGDAAGVPNELAVARMQLFGRLLLLSTYLRAAGLILIDNLPADVGNHSLPMFALHSAVLGSLVLALALVAVGLKSRTVALSLALINLGLVCYEHSFFSFIRREGGEWKFDEAEMRKSIKGFGLPEGDSLSPKEFEPWEVFDLHRYYFFQGLSTSGALLLLARFGPGELAVEEDEILLSDVQRVRD
jgi:uncharacterized membrane protein YphA (DoxX/SURF4 family)